GGWHGDAGYDGAHTLLGADGPRPTGILCGNDRVAFGVLDAAKELGIDVPGEVSVVGFDDEIEIAPYSHPALTTVRLPYDRMGFEAGQRMMTARRRDGVVLIGCELVVRASTGAPRPRPDGRSSTPR
ncbi:MAG TPA: substrate-binding domain-containing protein, partial [Protaetiibacter sp.]|nr:substrate-binding domain-containing protein [Protaetiibacter sp.]